MSPAQGIAQIRSVLDPLQSFPFENRAAEVYGKIRAELEAKGMTIGANDFMIAAIALENDLTVVTHNTKEFSRVASLRLEDWQ